MGPRAGLDGCGKSRPNRDSIEGPAVSSESLYRMRYPNGNILAEAITDSEGSRKNFCKSKLKEDKRNIKQALGYKLRDVKI